MFIPILYDISFRNCQAPPNIYYRWYILYQESLCYQYGMYVWK